jgi:hypothetical protein
MCNVLTIRKDPRLVSIPEERATYSESCEAVSTSTQRRCGLCGSEEIVELAPLFNGPMDPGPVPAAALAA